MLHTAPMEVAAAPEVVIVLIALKVLFTLF